MKLFLRNFVALVTVLMLVMSLFTVTFAEPAPAEETAPTEQATLEETTPPADAAPQATEPPEQNTLIINWDGSASVEYVAQPPAMYIDMLIGQLQQASTDYTVEKTDTDGVAGLKVTRTFQKGTPISIGLPTNPADLFAAVRIKGLFYDTYVIKHFLQPYFGGQADLTIKAPAMVTHYNGTKTKAGYTWTVDAATQVLPVELAVRIPNVWNILIFLAALVIIVAIILVTLSRKRKAALIGAMELAADEATEDGEGFTAEDAEVYFSEDDEQGLEEVTAEETVEEDTTEE